MMDLLNRAIDYLQAKFPPNRVAVLLTPLVLAPAAGWVSTWVADNLPGIQLDETTLTGIFVSGVIAGVTLGYKYLDGWQKAEERGDHL